jgi:hypothetical protein
VAQVFATTSTLWVVRAPVVRKPRNDARLVTRPALSSCLPIARMVSESSSSLERHVWLFACDASCERTRPESPVAHAVVATDASAQASSRRVIV